MSQLQVTGEAKIRDIQGPVVANSGVVTALDGDASQYVRGDGTLADFPTSTGGGSSVSYYLNSSVSQGTIGGVAYRQLGKTPISGAGTDIAISANGYVASYITDANDPALLEVPAGNFNCEFYFSVNNNTGNPFVYAEVYKYDGTTFTLIGTSVGVPEYITEGTVINPYYFAVPVATSVLTVTDRIAIRIYVNVDGRTVTLHTENNHLCQVVTTFSKGLISLNNLTRQNQFFATGTSGTDFNISSATATHTFNIPSASATNRGLITTGAQTIAGSKTFNATLYGVDSEFSGSVLSPIFSVINGANVVNLQSLATATRDIYLPDASGTLALTSNLSSYVPYTGATANVDLGTFALNAGAITTEAGYAFKILAAGTLFQNGYSVMSSLEGNISLTQAISAGNLKAFTFDFSSWATNTSRTFTLPDLSGTLALLEGGQTFSGAKTFSGGATFTTAINVNRQINISKTPSLVSYTGGYITNYGTTSGIIYADGDTSNLSTLNFNFGGNYTYTFPAATGTIALTSNLSSYVPYSGATASLDLGTFALSSNIVYVNGNSGSSIGGYLAFKQYSSSQLGTSGYSGIAALSQNLISLYYAQTGVDYKAIYLSSSLVSNNSTVTLQFPNASGTIALLSGTQTFTGATTFSLDIAVNGLTVGRGAGSVSTNTVLGLASFATNTTGTYNVAIGQSALNSNTTGGYNTAVGGSAMVANSTGSFNTAIGFGTLNYNSTGTNNTALGYSSLFTNTTGSQNTAIGNQALQFNTTGSANIGIGHIALQNNTTGGNNTAIGTNSLQLNTTGSQNTAIGFAALAKSVSVNGNTAIGYTALNNNIASFNTAIGSSTLVANTTGEYNTGIGYTSLVNNTTGGSNTAIGSQSLLANTTGSLNTAIGTNALLSNTTANGNNAFGASSLNATTSGSGNTAIGNQSLFTNTTGFNNIGIGNQTLQFSTTASGNIAIGHSAGNAITTGSNNTIIGNYAGTTTLANNIVLADGAGNIRYQWNGTNNVFGNPISGTSATFSGQVQAQTLLIRNSGVPAAQFFRDLDVTIVGSAGQGIEFGARNGATLTAGAAIYGGLDNPATTGNLVFQTLNGGSLSTKMTITSGGNVGIGTSSPVSFGSTFNNLTTSGSTGSFVLTTNLTNSIIGQVGVDNTLVYYGSRTNHDVTFTTNTIERMRITSGGNVGIGTSSAAYLLTLSLPSGVNGEIIRMSRSAGSYAWSLGIDGATSHFNFYNNSSSSVANINLSTGAYTATSDERLKENILDSDNAIEKLLQIKVRKYDWKDTDIKEDYGFVAQELYDVLPQYVSKGDEDRNWGVAKAELVPILVKAIQELKAEIEQLKNK